MPHPRGGPCDFFRNIARRCEMAGFYAASSRRSLRPEVWANRSSSRRFLCRILAAVPATDVELALRA